MSFDPKTAAVLIVDLQNDFLDPKGAYGRAGQTSSEIADLPSRILPLLKAIRQAGGWVVSTQFTLVPTLHIALPRRWGSFFRSTS